MCFFLEATLLATTGCFCFRAQQADSAAWEVVAACLPLFASIILRGGKCTWTLKIPPKKLGNAGAWRKSAWHPHDPPDGEKGRDITSAQWGGNESWAKKKKSPTAGGEEKKIHTQMATATKQSPPCTEAMCSKLAACSCLPQRASSASGLLRFPLPHGAPAPDSKGPLCPVSICQLLLRGLVGKRWKREESVSLCSAATQHLLLDAAASEEAGGDSPEQVWMRDGQRDQLLVRTRGLELH